MSSISSTSGSSYNRITGLASGLDTDNLVKQMMQPYRMKVDQSKQNRDLLVLKQDLYRDIIKDLRGIFSKYTDVSKTDSLLLSKNYGTSKFTSGNESIAVEGLAGATTGNYKLQVDALAKPAKVEIDNVSALTGKSIKLVDNSGKSVTIDLTDPVLTESDVIAKVNNEMKTAGLDAKVTKSDLTGKLIFQTNGVGSNKYIKIENVTTTTNTMNANLSDMAGKTVVFNINGSETTINFSGITTEVDTIKKINDTLGTKGIQATGNGSGSIIIGSTNSSTTNILELKDTNGVTLRSGVSTTNNSQVFDAIGSKSSVIITDSYGNTATKEYDANEFIIDGVKFKISDVTTGAVSIVGKTDTTALKDKLKEFVKDYNTIIGKITTKLGEKTSSKYVPLTDEQREAMSEEEIKKWEDKVKEGLLKRDNDLTSITSQLRSAFNTPVAGTTLDLRQLGIDFSNDMTKSGQLVIDEEKLTKTLENRPEDVVKMFTQLAPSNLTSKQDIHSNSGILQRVKTILNDFVMSSASSFLKRVGYEGTSTYIKNDITDELLKREKKIAEMENSLVDRENRFYAKFAALEKAMNNYNSQSSWLSQQLGGGQ